MISQGELLANVLNIRNEIPTVKQRNRSRYYNVPAAFDIETSSFYIDGEKQGCMYIWMFGFYKWVTYGRTWDEYKKFIHRLSIALDLAYDVRLAVYIHNMPYEFQWMRKHFTWDATFFLEERKPVYGVVDGIEYRDSLKLAQKKLAKVGEDDLKKYPVHKMVGDLNYNLIRTPDTPLTEKELGYCENDVRVLLSYIQEKIESDGDITKIPMTNTGYVRNYCRKNCFNRYKRYRGLMNELTLEPEEYLELKECFQGGFTHANSRYSGKILKNVASYDFTSSYPFTMIAKKFPMSKGRRITEEIDSETLNMYLARYCCMFRLTIYDVFPTQHNDHPISKSKCIGVDDNDVFVVDNGRVVYASKLTITCTEVDFAIYEAFYRWDRMEISDLYIYEKGYLPKDFVLSIITLYKDKTKLKGVHGKELEYLIAKGMLNSAYGMCVTDIVRDIIEYLSDAPDPFKSSKPDLEQAIVDYNESKKRFLFYPWGVWVTAWARFNLFTGILEYGNDYIYADTDSLKVLNYEKHLDYIQTYNYNVMAELMAAAKHHNIPLSELSPCNIKGVEKPIGVWDFEGVYDEFKTLGAKRYFMRKGENYYLTVAGLNKELGCEYLVSHFEDPFEAFAENLYVPPEYSGRLTSTYIDFECEGTVVDYTGSKNYYHELSFIHMEPSEYDMTISDVYKEFIKYVQGVKEERW